MAGVLSEEVVLQRGLQGLPGTGWYVPEGSGAGPWEDRSASYTGSTWTVSSELGERVEAWLEQAAEAGDLEEVDGWRAAAQVAALERQVEELQGQVAGLEGEQARVEYLQGRVANAEARVASAEEAGHTLRDGQVWSLRREQKLHDQVLALELNALALQEQVRYFECEEPGLRFTRRQERDDARESEVRSKLYWQHKGEMEQVQAAAAMEVAAAEAETAEMLEEAESDTEFFADAVGWLLDRVDGEQLDSEEQARWEDIRRGWADWQEEEEEAEEDSMPSIPEGEAEPAEKIRCTNTSCARLSQWLGSCGCPFAFKEVAGVMVVCAVEDENGKEE